MSLSAALLLFLFIFVACILLALGFASLVVALVAQDTSKICGGIYNFACCWSAAIIIFVGVFKFILV